MMHFGKRKNIDAFNPFMVVVIIWIFDIFENTLGINNE